MHKLAEQIYHYTGRLMTFPPEYVPKANHVFGLWQDHIDMIHYCRRHGLYGMHGLIGLTENTKIMVRKDGLTAFIETPKGCVVYDLIPEEDTL